MKASPASRARRVRANSCSPSSANTACRTHATRPERLVLDVSHHPALERAPHLRRALDRRDAPDDRLRLDVLEHCLAVGLAQRVDRQRDRRQAIRVLRPLLALRPRHLAPRRAPQRQAVVGDVVVQVDETWVDDRVAGLHHVGAVESRRRGIGLRRDRHDQPVGGLTEAQSTALNARQADIDDVVVNEGNAGTTPARSR